ncbi:MAG: YdaU family protein, partial [Candidatus Angelobacter sp.]
MNYYPFHIGDFRSGTVNMSRQARWIYRDMLDVYYDTEQPLSLDIEELCDQLGAESDEERRIVERLLRFKFVKTDDGYRHAICDQVIAEYHVKADTAKTNGKKGGRPKKANGNPEKPSGFQSGSDQPADWKPQPTGSQTNQEPITNKEEPPKPPAGGLTVVANPEVKPKTRGVALKTFLADCKANGLRPVRDYEP